MSLQNNLLLRTLRGEQVERPPVWLMRQAGRILPQYRELRGKLSGFIELVQTPDLAAEVTIQPIDELGVDAAIIFSDILVIPEAMGLDYELVEKVGPRFPTTIKTAQQIEDLIEGVDAAGHLSYVYEAVKATKQGLNNRVPLIGFAGAPWTLFAYMIEGGGSKTFSQAKKFLYQQPTLSHQLLSKITTSVIEYLKLKINAGVDVVQVFDSWADLLTPKLYSEFCIPYLKRIGDEVKGVPKILFAKGAWFALEEFKELDYEGVGLDWKTSPSMARELLGTSKVLQGNLDPCMLYADADRIENAAKDMVAQFGSKHIVNLGHGVYPDTPLENVKIFVNTIKSQSYT